jgi:hypothetical protein
VALGGIAAAEGESFLNHLYSKMIGTSNYGNFGWPSTTGYSSRRSFPDGPERIKLYRKLADYHYTHAPAMLGVFRYSNVLLHPWVMGWKSHSSAVFLGFIDVARQAAAKGGARYRGYPATVSAC